MLSRITVAQRLLFAFGSATLMCAAIATLAIVQMQTLADQLGTPEALAASRHAAWLIGGLAAAASAGGVVVSLWIVRGLMAALGAEPRLLGACARRVADGDLGGPVPAGARGVMGDLARMQQQLVQLVGAVRAEADAVHARGREIAEQSLAQQQQADAGARHIHEAALLITRLASQTGVLALNAAAAESQSRGHALGALGSRMAALDGQTREGAALIARSGQAAQAMAQRSARLVQAVAAFRLATPASAALPPAAAAMLPSDGYQASHPPGRRPLQPGRG